MVLIIYSFHLNVSQKHKLSILKHSCVFHSSVILKSRGEIRPILTTRIWSFSPGLENNHTLKCWSGIFPTILTYILCCKIARTTFQCKVVLQSRGQHFILVEILWKQDLRVEHKRKKKFFFATVETFLCILLHSKYFLATKQLYWFIATSQVVFQTDRLLRPRA